MRAKLVLLLGFALIALFPSQLGLHFWPSFAKPNGIKVDYLSPTLLFTDLLGIVFIFFSKPVFSKKIFILPILNLLFSISFFISFFHWLRIFLYYFIFLSFKQFLPYFKKYWLIALSLSVAWTSSLAIMQFITSSNLGGYWYWLGERPLSLAMPYISKVFLPNLGFFLRPYATFPHPNALAGYLLVSLIIIYQNRKLLARRSLGVVGCLGSIGLFLTFSKTIFFPLAFLMPKDIVSRSISERLELTQNSLLITHNYLLTGTGLGAYPAAAISLPSTDLRLSYQPVHNIFLLLLAELGLPMFLIFCHFVIKSFKHLLNIEYWTLAIVLMITSAIDHYWLTSPSNLLLLTFVFSLIQWTSVTNKNNF